MAKMTRQKRGGKTKITKAKRRRGQAAASKVLAIPELLEAILLELPPRTLLLAQRVNKTFRESISTSVHVQQKLFFKARSSRPGDGSSEVNPFLGRIVTLAGRKCVPYLDLEDDSYATDGRLGNFVDRTTIAPYKIKKNQHVEVYKKSPGLFYQVEKSQETEHSWQRMLVADPPCLFRIQDELVSYEYREESVTPENMGDLMNALDRPWIERGQTDSDVEGYTDDRHNDSDSDNEREEDDESGVVDWT